MFTGAHVLLYSTNADADRAFFKDVLQFRSVDAGHGWLIFTLPPAELALHPGDGQFVQQNGGDTLPGALLWLMCDNLSATIATLEAKGVACTALAEEPWGVRTTFRLPSGAQLGLYRPTHPTAIAAK